MFLAGVKKTILLFLLITLTKYMEAQLQTDSITGAYYLKGVMETASGFKLNADSTFEFFFS